MLTWETCSVQGGCGDAIWMGGRICRRDSVQGLYCNRWPPVLRYLTWLRGTYWPFSSFSCMMHLRQSRLNPILLHWTFSRKDRRKCTFGYIQTVIQNSIMWRLMASYRWGHHPMVLTDQCFLDFSSQSVPDCRQTSRKGSFRKFV